MIMMGILIVAVPEVLVAFVAASVAVIGISILYFGHMARKADSEWNGFERSMSPHVRIFRDPFRHTFFWRY
jgi:hypothetical protein